MDPLSDILSLLRPRSTKVGGFEAGGDWCVRFDRYDGIKCYAVDAGACWLAVEGIPDPVRLQAGDCYLLPRGRPFRVGSNLDLAPVDAASVFPAPIAGGIVRLNGGGDFSSVGGHFLLTGPNADLLRDVLPSIVHIRSESDRAAMRWSLERMRQELREPQPGGLLVAQHLADMMLVQALRLHLAEGLRGGVGWLFALADPRMRAAMEAMHGDPARRWMLQDLAERAGMSRSTFALRFKETAGVSPMEYLTRWRMMLAGDRLATSTDPVSAVAVSLGYDSESAFSTAFKRVMGCSPRQHGRSRRAALAAAA